MQLFINELLEIFPGFHLEIKTFPTSGQISLEGCWVCGTDENMFYDIRWYYKKGQSIDTAIAELRDRLEGRKK